jgi:inosine-uridine nucleoside N-ribohydrolase
MTRPVVLDTDIGSDMDDSWALAMLLGCPGLHLRLVVTATADTTYRAREEVVYLDFDTLERRPKLSAEWFREAARQNAVV